jgi:hypothetical protein
MCQSGESASILWAVLNHGLELCFVSLVNVVRKASANIEGMKLSALQKQQGEK